MHANITDGSVWVLKCRLIGTYHNVSEAHLGHYCAEFDFRYNQRTVSDAERAAAALKGIEGKRLTYRRAHAG